MSKQIERISINISGLLGTLLTVLFVGLKLCNVITWSWIWVLSPLWIGWALGIIIFAIIFICVAFFD
jgi:hypothetical protein